MEKAWHKCQQHAGYGRQAMNIMESGRWDMGSQDEGIQGIFSTTVDIR